MKEIGRFFGSALAALCVVLVSTIAWGQPIPTPTQGVACDHWARPIELTLAPGQELSLGRLVEVVAEDMPPAAAQSSAAARDITVPRLASRAGSTHAESVVSLVGAIYAGSDSTTRQAIVSVAIEAIRHAGPTRLKLDEFYTYCDGPPREGGSQERVPTAGRFCPDGTPIKRAHRARMLSRDFSGDLLTGSFPTGQPGDDFTSWTHYPGHTLRAFLRSSRSNQAYTLVVNRAYNATHHPRPGAHLCRELPSLVQGAPPTDVAGKTALFQNVGTWLSATVLEGDLTTAAWATSFAPTVYARAAGLEALGLCEGRERQALIERNQARDATLLAQGQTRAAEGRAAKFFTALITTIIVATVFIIVMFFSLRRWAKRQVEAVIRDAKALLDTKFLEGAKHGAATIWASIKPEIVELSRLAKVYVPSTESVGQPFKVDDLGKLVDDACAAPEELMRSLRTAMSELLNDKFGITVSPPVSGQRLSIEAVSFVENAVTSVKELVEFIHEVCQGEDAPFGESASASQIDKARGMLVGLVIAIRKMADTLEGKDVSASTVATEKTALRGEPVLPLLARITKLITELREQLEGLEERLAAQTGGSTNVISIVRTGETPLGTRKR